MDGDPDRKTTGFSVVHLQESSAITPGGHLRGRNKDMNNDKESTRKATGFRGTSQSQPITPRRKEYMRREISNTSRAVQTHTVASGDSIRNAPDELF